MNCQGFDASLLDALYEELDAPAAAAMDEHARTCSACSARAARLRGVRELTAQHLVVGAPPGLEARILAAAEGANVIPLRARRERTGIVAVLSRPYLAVAASIVLVIGAATLFLAPSAKRAPASASAPAAEARVAASATSPMMAATTEAEPPPPGDAVPAAVAAAPAPVVAKTKAAGAAGPSLAERSLADGGAYAAKAERASAPATKAAKPASPRATAAAGDAFGR
jgi:hypothetical protein